MMVLRGIRCHQAVGRPGATRSSGVRRRTASRGARPRPYTAGSEQSSTDRLGARCIARSGGRSRTPCRYRAAGGRQPAPRSRSPPRAERQLARFGSSLPESWSPRAGTARHPGSPSWRSDTDGATGNTATTRVQSRACFRSRFRPDEPLQTPHRGPGYALVIDDLRQRRVRRHPPAKLARRARRYIRSFPGSSSGFGESCRGASVFGRFGARSVVVVAVAGPPLRSGSPLGWPV
jgi:hypothetical protein